MTQNMSSESKESSEAPQDSVLTPEREEPNCKFTFGWIRVGFCALLIRILLISDDEDMPLNLSTKRPSASSDERDSQHQKHHRSSIIWSPPSMCERETSENHHHNEENSVESVDNKSNLTVFQKRLLSENYNNNNDLESERKNLMLKNTNLFNHFDFEKIHFLNKSLSENSGKLKNATKNMDFLAAATAFQHQQQQQQHHHHHQQQLEYTHNQHQLVHHKKRQHKSLGILKQNGTDIFVLNNNNNYNNNNIQHNNDSNNSNNQLDNTDDHKKLVYSEQHEQRPDSTAHSESFMGGDFSERSRKERNFQVSDI
jgi:hypothetical protein